MKTLLAIVMISLAGSSFGASACQKCKDVGFRFEYETCPACKGKGTVMRSVYHRSLRYGRVGSQIVTSRCPECGKIGNQLGKVKVKVYCGCKTGKAKKERDEKPRKMALK